MAVLTQEGFSAGWGDVEPASVLPSGAVIVTESPFRQCTCLSGSSDLVEGSPAVQTVPRDGQWSSFPLRGGGRQAKEPGLHLGWGGLHV